MNDENTYGDFASILNDLHLSKHEIWGLDLEKTGHFFVLVDYKDPNAKPEECLLCNDNISIIDNGSIIDSESYLEIIRQKRYENFQNYLAQLPKQAYYIIFGFLGLLYVSLLRIKNYL